MSDERIILYSFNEVGRLTLIWLFMSFSLAMSAIHAHQRWRNPYLTTALIWGSFAALVLGVVGDALLTILREMAHLHGVSV